MGLKKALSYFTALALLSCGGRSGLLEFAESEPGGARAIGGSRATAAAGASNGGTVSGSGGVAQAGAASFAGGNAPGGAPSSGGATAVGPWATLSHSEPPPPHDNPFDYIGSPTTYTDVWSDGANQVLIATFTPGYKAPGSGSVIRFEDGQKLAFDAGQGRLYAPPRLAGLSLSDLWLAEDSFGLRHSDGNSWTAYEEPTAPLVWENAPNDVWACSKVTSAAGQVSYGLAHWDGSVWKQLALPPLSGFVPSALWSRSPTDTFIAGNAGTVLHWTGTSFELRECPGAGVWNAVWGDAAAVWTVGEGGAVARWQGDHCTLLPTEGLLGGLLALNDIWGSSADNIWIVGQGGSILRWNGAALELESSGQALNLYAVWGHVSGVVWAVGEAETLLRRTF